MATHTKEKLPVKESTIALRDDGSGYCSNCLYTWCSLKGMILYCSMKYKGEISFICENNKCGAF